MSSASATSGATDAGHPDDSGNPDDSGHPEDAGQTDGCTLTPWYPDADGDGYGDKNAEAVMACTQPLSHVANNEDCDDTPVTGVAYHPGATETVGNGVDEDCDGADDCYEDSDNDEYGSSVVVPDTNLDCTDSSASTSAVNTDCNDADFAIHLGATEAWYDGIDSDCAGNDDYDRDADGFVRDQDVGLVTYKDSTHLQPVPETGLLPGGDCDDDHAQVSPVGQEAVFRVDVTCPMDNLDNDCDGAADSADWDCGDRDGDGVANGVDYISPLDYQLSDGFPETGVIPDFAMDEPWRTNPDGGVRHVIRHGSPGGTWGGFGEPLPVTQVIFPTVIPGNALHSEWCFDFSESANANYVWSVVSPLALDGVSAVNQDDCATWVHARLKTYCECYELHQTPCDTQTFLDRAHETYCRNVSAIGGCATGQGFGLVVSGGKITGPF